MNRRERGGAAGVPHPPEHNLIQRPELLRRLAQRLGLRQAHVIPTLNEGVQPVVILEDVREPKTDTAPHAMHAMDGTAGDGATLRSACGLWNPVGSGLVVTVNWIEGYAPNTVVPDTVSVGVTRSAGVAGILTVDGFAWADPDIPAVAAGDNAHAVPCFGRIAAGAALPLFAARVENVITNRFYCRFEPGLRLSPGALLLVNLGSVAASNRLFAVTFDWTEERL